MPLTKCVLLIWICSVVFLRCAGQEIITSTVRGFIGLNTLRREAVLLYDSVDEGTQQQRILPSMSFSCSGNISKWSFVARSRSRDQYPLFQLWRPDGTGRYRRVYESSITSTMSGQSDFTVEEYIPNDPVPFEAGYILGVYQPRQSLRRLSVVYVDVPSGYGYDNYIRDSVMMSLEEFNTGRSIVGNNYPLVAVNTASPQCVQGFLNEEAVRIATDLYATRQRVNFMYMYDQQLIIPNTTFTRNGSVVRWTFAAQYRPSATKYPELQVWRENTTGRYVKVGNTSNIEPNQTGYLNVYEYVLDPPLQVLAGDVLGIHQPSSANSRLALLFLQSFSYVNWYTTAPRPQDSFMVTGSQTNNVFPLVTVSFEPEETMAPAESSTVLPTSTAHPNPGTTTQVGTMTKVGTTPQVGTTTGFFVSTPLPDMPPVSYTSSLTLLPTPGSRTPVGGVPVGPIVGALVGLMVVVVAALAVVLLVVLMLRKRQKKIPREVDAQERTPTYRDSTEQNTSAPDEEKFEHFEMNTNDAYATNTAEITTTGNVAYMTAGDTILATQNVAYGQVPPGTDECYDYVI